LRSYFGIRGVAPALGKRLGAPLERLSFIYFARWTLLREPAADAEPSLGPPNFGASRPGETSGGFGLRGRRRTRTYLLFESNFTGRWDQYIDAFAYVLGSRMSLIWGGAYGFPGPRPAEPFKRYIRRNELPAAHFYSSYPEATTTTILHALRLDRELDAFIDDASDLQPREFAALYRRFERDVQEFI
jgi:hypothetical protein